MSTDTVLPSTTSLKLLKFAASSFAISLMSWRGAVPKRILGGPRVDGLSADYSRREARLGGSASTLASPIGQQPPDRPRALWVASTQRDVLPVRPLSPRAAPQLHPPARSPGLKQSQMFLKLACLGGTGGKLLCLGVTGGKLPRRGGKLPLPLPLPAGRGHSA